MHQLTHVLLRAYSLGAGGPTAFAAARAAVHAQEEPHGPARAEAAALLIALAAELHRPVEAVLGDLGVFLLTHPLVESLAPALLKGCAGARALLCERLGLLSPLLFQDLAGAEVVVETLEHARDLLQVRYQGPVHPLRLCCLLRGSIEGAGSRFQTRLQIQELTCQCQRSPHCQIAVRFPTSARTGPAGSYPGEQQDTAGQVLTGERPTVAASYGAAAAEAVSLEEQQTALLVLRLLSLHEPPDPVSSHAPHVGRTVPGLTFFEIQAVLKRRGFTAAYASPGPLLRVLNHLVEAGAVTSLPLLAVGPGNPAGKAASGEVQATANGYRITAEGKHRLEQGD